MITVIILVIFLYLLLNSNVKISIDNYNKTKLKIYFLKLKVYDKYLESEKFKYINLKDLKNINLKTYLYTFNKLIKLLKYIILKTNIEEININFKIKNYIHYSYLYAFLNYIYATCKITNYDINCNKEKTKFNCIINIKLVNIINILIKIICLVVKGGIKNATSNRRINDNSNGLARDNGRC